MSSSTMISHVLCCNYVLVLCVFYCNVIVCFFSVCPELICPLWKTVPICVLCKYAVTCYTTVYKYDIVHTYIYICTIYCKLFKVEKFCGCRTQL